MPRKPPGSRARGLGAELRQLREKRGLTLDQAAEGVGWNKSLLSRLETGKRNISSEEVAALLVVYRVHGPERDILISRARSVDEPGWWNVGLPGLPPNSATLASYEAEAKRLVDWSPMLIPGLLQTMEYGRAYMQADSIDSKAIELRLTARLRRQQVLRDEAVDYVALVGESALHCQVGTAKVMVEQMRALLAADERANVTVRIVPSSAPPHPGLLGGFMLLEFPAAPSVVLVELLRSSAFHDQEAQTGPYLAAVDRVAAVALGATESRSLMASVISEMEGA